MSKSSPKTVLLVPFSSDDPSRNNIWRHVRAWLKKTLDYPMYIGEQFPDKPIEYNLSLARNKAASLAGDWEVAVIHDSDTVISPQQIQAGVAAAMETGAVTYPFTQRLELDDEGTKMLLKDESSDWQSHLKRYNRNQPLGGCIIVRRDLWDLVRGFDSGFIGWGHEDGAFAMACETLSGKKLQRVAGKSLHLDHNPAPAKQQDNPVYLANQARVKHYLEAVKKPDGAKIIRKLRDESISTDKKDGIVWPTIKDKNSVMDKATALMLLADVTSVLDKYKSTHWLSDGTLLGAIRENNFISHDYDVDLGVWAADFDPRVIGELLNRYGCRILRLQGTPDDGMVVTVGRVGLHLDLFFYYETKKTSKANKKTTKTGIYHSIYELVKPYNTSNKAKRFDCKYPDFKPLVRRKFLGHEFWVPKNAEENIVAAYGPDWKKPKKDWDVFKDQYNMELHSTVQDMTAERQKTEEYLGIRRA